MSLLLLLNNFKKPNIQSNHGNVGSEQEEGRSKRDPSKISLLQQENDVSMSVLRSRRAFLRVVVLDEIDQLIQRDKKAQTILYELFKWTTLKNSTLVLCGTCDDCAPSKTAPRYCQYKEHGTTLATAPSSQL
jgi:hypothetical protein